MEMENLPVYISMILVLTTCLIVYVFYKATNHSKLTLALIFLWITAQSVLSLSGFYKVTDTLPPRFTLMIAPPVLIIIVLFFTSFGRRYIDGLNPGYLTLLHTMRVPVELVLFWLFLHKAVPKIMTFEGANFDILSGLSAPFIFYFGYMKRSISRRTILLWNFICLALLINIVILGILAAPVRFQKLAFDQPNLALSYFPFVWLPCCIVPLVLLSHAAAIRQLLLGAKNATASLVSKEIFTLWSQQNRT